MTDLHWVTSFSVPKLLYVKSQWVLVLKIYFKLTNDRVEPSFTLKCSQAASPLFQIRKLFKEVHSSKDHQ